MEPKINEENHAMQEITALLEQRKEEIEQLRKEKEDLRTRLVHIRAFCTPAETSGETLDRRMNACADFIEAWYGKVGEEVKKESLEDGGFRIKITGSDAAVTVVLFRDSKGKLDISFAAKRKYGCYGCLLWPLAWLEQENMLPAPKLLEDVRQNVLRFFANC